LRDERRKADNREERLKAWDALVQQERIAERWKHELEQAVTSYEAQIKKIKKENRNLKQSVMELRAKVEYPKHAYLQDSPESTQSQSPEQVEPEREFA
jgi:predicted nuclease with TOPRIM domain